MTDRREMMGVRVEQVGTEWVLLMDHEGEVTRRSFSSKSEAEETATVIQNATSLLRQSQALGDWNLDTMKRGGG